MYLEYPNKKTENEILTRPTYCKLSNIGNTVSKNKLYVGDNYEIMRCMLDDYDMAGKINFVYIDPPFSTNNIFKISDERASTISSSHSDEIAYRDLLKGSDFIEFLRERIILLRELMSDNSSLYLHIDYKIGHYVKVMMDEIFGIENFRNDIARIKCNPKNFKRKAYGNIKDLILFYTKGNDYVWNEPRVDLTDEDLKRLCQKVNEQGRSYTTVPIHAPGETRNGSTGQPWRGMNPPKGRHWRCSPDELDDLDKNGLIEWSKNGNPRKIVFAEEKAKKGKKLQDIWKYKDPQSPVYPTQKNRELLDLLISTSSNEGDLIMDCFAGSGTTIMSANELGRHWVGVDESEHAIEVVQNRLSQSKNNFLFCKDSDFEVYHLERIRAVSQT